MSPPNIVFKAGGSGKEGAGATTIDSNAGGGDGECKDALSRSGSGASGDEGPARAGADEEKKEEEEGVVPPPHPNLNMEISSGRSNGGGETDGKAEGRDDATNENDTKNVSRDVERPAAPPRPSGSMPLSRRSTSLPLIAFSSGLARKSSPFLLSSWVSLALTLDGRDKITKVVQYSSRLLGWYYETLSKSIYALEGEGKGSAAYYARAALGWRALQKHLTESRKAFRLGRGLIEMEKLRGMGWGDWIRWWLRNAMLLEGEEGGFDDDERRQTRGRAADRRPKARPKGVRARRASSNVGWGPTTTFGEEDGDNDTDSTSSPAPSPGRTQSPAPRSALVSNDKAESAGGGENKSAGGATIARRPNRPHLPRRVSSNVGWGPLTTAPVAIRPPPGRRPSSFYRTASALGRWMYGPPSASLGTTSSALSETTSAAAPAWKLLFSTIKLLGLLGFWTADNASFLHSSGFFDDHRLPSKDDRLRLRADSKGRWSRMGARSYFVAASAGLVVSLREALGHRSGKLSVCVHRVRELEERKTRAEAAERRRRKRAEAERRDSWDPEDEDEVDSRDSWSGEEEDDEHHRFDERELEEARKALKAAEGRQFTLFLALLKSCCDVIVFSNNPGVDLHKRYRGKKMNEGFHSVCGLVSASTVIYNNFPNAVPKAQAQAKGAKGGK